MSVDFDEVYRQHADQLFAFIRSMLREQADADDCFQQTWMSIYKALPRYQETGQLRAWLFQIARRSVYDFLRRRREWQSFEDEAVDVISDDDPLEQLQAAELQEHLDAAIAGLSPKLRSVFLLRTQQGLSFNEIAEILEEPRNRLLARMHLANKQLTQSIIQFRGTSS